VARYVAQVTAHRIACSGVRPGVLHSLLSAHAPRCGRAAAVARP